MSTAIQDVLTRALGYSTQDNAADLYSNTSEIIAQVAAFERDIFRVAAAFTRNLVVQASSSFNSTNAAANRTVDLSTASPGVERIIRIQLGGVWVSLVDLEDVDAELPPRAYLLGSTLTEVGSDWGATGVVALVIDYVVKPATLDPTSNLSQTITLPDEFADLLAIRLAHYLSIKDVGRDPAEAQELDTIYQTRLKSMLDALDHREGEARRRFLAPYIVPGGSE